MSSHAEQNRRGEFRLPLSAESLPEREQRLYEYLRRITAADGSALELFYDETHIILYSVLHLILGNAADADEIALDVYTYVWHSAAAYDARRGSILGWLIMLARSRAIDRLRSRAAMQQTEVQCTKDDLITAESSRNVSHIEQHILIKRILGQLSCEEREVIELAFYFGLSHHELAARLKMPLGTVKSRIRTALARLRNMLSNGSLTYEPDHTRPSR